MQRPDEAALRLATAIIASSHDAIISTDRQDLVTSWNAAATRMFGYEPADIVGQSFHLLQTDHPHDGDGIGPADTVWRHQDGTPIPVSVTVSPIRDDTGTLVGTARTARNRSAHLERDAKRDRLLAAAEERAAITEKLSQVGAIVVSDLDRSTVVQAVTDAATALTGAEFGAFFYNVTDDTGESYMLYTISGVPREAFSKFPMPRNTRIFGPTFRGERIVRSDDITKDPRYGHNPPYHGMPPGHLPVRSHLAVPVKAGSGEVLGGLFFGHPDAGRFTEAHERLAVGIANWASVALENARLYIDLQGANRLKDEFLATLSHELRTPLNAVLGYARMARIGILDSGKQAQAIDTIERNATLLAQIIEDVLDLSRIISGRMRLQLEAVDLRTVVRQAVDAVSPAAEAKGVDIDTVFDPPILVVSGDPARLQQVIWNLVSNAVKFTGRGGRVDLRVESARSGVRIEVSDTGIGMTREFLPHVFERFRQFDVGTTRAHGGLGIGLGITRHLVEMHGGTIEATSPGPGGGSTFRIILPAVVPSEAVRHVRRRA